MVSCFWPSVVLAVEIIAQRSSECRSDAIAIG